MVCPGWLGLANPMGNKYCFANYCKLLYYGVPWVTQIG